MLAGPGTGKTTTLVESVAAPGRPRRRPGAHPGAHVQPQGRRRAARPHGRRGIGAARAPQATTFHSFCYALVRAHQDADLFAEPLRLLSGPEQDVDGPRAARRPGGLERLGRAQVRWPDELRACLTTRGFADEVRAVLARSRELGLGPGALAAFARRIGRPDWRAAAAFLAEYLDVLDLQGVLDYAELVHRAVLLAAPPRGRRAARRALRRGLRRRVPGHRPGAGTAAARARRRRPHPGRLRRPRPVDLRLPRRRRERHPRLPRRLPARATAAPPRSRSSRTSRRSGAALLAATRLLTRGCR